MHKKLLLITALASLICHANAQIPITQARNSMRNGDQLCKVKIDYVNPGQCGENQTWLLGQDKKDSEYVFQTIVSSIDTIAIFENGEIHHFLMHGDTLTAKGEQSRRAYYLNNDERQLLRYPFEFGDSIAGNYTGEGRDENTPYIKEGWGSTVADGIGILTDGEDTLRHITRLHFFDDYTQSYSGKDKIRMLSDRHCWYCAGYRYPVMESVCWKMVDDENNQYAIDSASYLFLPIMQMELAEDLQNDSILNELAMADALMNREQTNYVFLSNVSISLSADGTRMLLNYSLNVCGDIDLWACDILGNILGYAHLNNQKEGECYESINLSRHPVGNTLMLIARCEGNIFSIKTNI